MNFSRTHASLLFLTAFMCFQNVHAAGVSPVFLSEPSAIPADPSVGKTIAFQVNAKSSSGSPLVVSFDYGDGTQDMLGTHVYALAGDYTVQITAADREGIAAATLQLTINGSGAVLMASRDCLPGIVNLWVKSESIKVGAAGKGSWRAQYIYNIDRTTPGIFNPSTDVFVASIGTIPAAQVNPNQFTGLPPALAFKSAKGITPAVAVAINESTQTITVSASAATFTDKVPGTFHNTVKLGTNVFALDVALDAKGKFTGNSGYRSAAFVVSSGTVSIKGAGKDSLALSLLLADPLFKYPGTSGAKTVRLRVTNSAGLVVLDKDFTAIATISNGKIKTGKDAVSPAGKFSYDSIKGKMTASVSKATLSGELTHPEEQVRVDVLIGDQTYSSRVTLFAPKAGSYSTKMGKGVHQTLGAKRPTVTITNPVNNATGIATNQKITATFSGPMDPTTINTASFTVQQGSAFVAGNVTFANSTATFTSIGNLAANSAFTATITTAAKDTSGIPLGSDYVWCFTTGASTDNTPPTVVATNPLSAATGVALNTKITATFSEGMDAASINTSTFTLMQGAVAVPGTVSSASIGSTATFTPSSNLAANTAYTATVSTGVKDLAGNAMAAAYIWSFTTGASIDATPPNVIAVNPADLATNIGINQVENATFDKAMDPATINTVNFTLAAPGPNAITGMVTYDVSSKIATFTPSSNLTPNTTYTVTLSTGAKDLAGNALAASKVWTFTTSAKQVLQPVALGAAAAYGTFGGGSGMTNQGIFTVINGDIGTTGASTTVTGFHDSTGDIYTETPLNQGKVNGRIYTAPPTPGGAGVGGNASTFAIASQAASDANAAYINLSPASLPGGIDPGAGQLGGLTLAPGIYKAAGDSFMITGSDLTLDAQGDSNAVWVFQMASSLTVGGPGAPRTVNMINGAKPKNVFWQVGSSATINAAGGGTMVGTIIASSGVTFSTAGNVTLVTLNGRALGLNASTTVVNTIVNVPAP